MNASAKHQSEEKQENIEIKLISLVSDDKYTSIFGKLLNDVAEKIDINDIVLMTARRCDNINAGIKDFVFSIVALSLSIEALIDENINLRDSLDILAKEQLK